MTHAHDEHENEYDLRAKLIDGQIYRWRWSDDARHADSAPYRSYHCKSQIAVAKNGLLVDTYWFGGGAEYALDLNKVEITFFADQSWQTISEWDVPYYAPSDIANTRHPNDSRAPIYLKPGAKRDAATILAAVEYCEETARAEIKSGERQLARMIEARRLVDANRLDEVML